MEFIKTWDDLRNFYPEISQACRESHSPIFITFDGRGDTVIIGIEQYEQMIATLDLLFMLAETEEEVEMKQVAPIEYTFKYIRQSLVAGKMGNER